MADATTVILRAPTPDTAITALLARDLTDKERARCDRLRQPADVWNFVVGRALARHALRVSCGLGRPILDISDLGQPRVAGQSAHVSIAHAGGMVACAASRRFAVGVDVEPITRLAERDAIVSDVFAPAEQALVATCPPAQGDEFFLRVWTLKEAVVKATGLGPNLPPASFAVSLEPPALIAGGNEVRPVADWRLRQWRLDDSAWLALALRGSGAGNATVDLQELTMAELVDGLSAHGD